ncbi:carbon-nitrogen hydrolase family protein [Stieleria magnilauensis]|uniref:carbon-nitrogen hydrolase family protein n=1 Tax=Stieleria magnilauensis TaxID=2527963 RepID=UPI003AF54A88
MKVAAVQISGYDKGELPRDEFDPSGKLVPCIDRAGRDGAQLVVFPEYVLGHIEVPGPATKPISEAARANSIYVIVGCWEESGDGTFANVALVFGRNGEIIGRYRKTHPAIDHFEGHDPWKRPPLGKSRRWMLEHDPEWTMQAGDDLPVFELDFGRVGIMTCYDGWFPELPRVLSLRGAELIVWINGRRGTVEDFNRCPMRHFTWAVVALPLDLSSPIFLNRAAAASREHESSTLPGLLGLNQANASVDFA